MAKVTQIYDVDLKLLRCFCTLVEEGSFTAAQASLNISQSMLSEYLKSLELKLGFSLCQRGPRGFKLYTEGRDVYHAARKLLQSVEGFRQDVNSIDEGAYGELFVGVQEGILDNPCSRVPHALEKMGALFPNIRLRLEIMLGFQMTGKVADGLLHLGIGIESDRYSNLEYHYLFEEKGATFCSRSHALFNLADDQISEVTLRSHRWSNRGHLERRDSSAPLDTSSGDIGHGSQAHLALVLSGRDIGHLAAHVASPYVNSGLIRVVRPDLTTKSSRVGAVLGSTSKQFKPALTLLALLVDSHADLRVNNRPPKLQAV